MKIDTKLIAARPNDAAKNTNFTEAVMARVGKSKHAKRGWLRMALHKSPAVVIAIIIGAVLLLSGAAYAISYLWPQIIPSVSSPTTSSSGRKFITVEDCSKAGASSSYELKKDAPIAADKLEDVVKAQCELNAVSAWADKTYPLEYHAPSQEEANKPGATLTHTTITPAMFAVQIASIGDTTIRIRDSGSLLERDIPYSNTTKIVVQGQYASLRELKAGDAITYVDKTTTTTKNRADCTIDSCMGDIVSTSTELLAIVKLSYSFDTYRAISYLVESTHCAGNPLDDCPNTSSMDVFMGDPSEHGYTNLENSQVAQITGKIQTYSDSEITLITSSGRAVTIGTPWNLIDTSNDKNSLNKISVGDTLQVEYAQDINAKSDTSISWKRLYRVILLLEADSKAGPYRNY